MAADVGSPASTDRGKAGGARDRWRVNSLERNNMMLKLFSKPAIVLALAIFSGTPSLSALFTGEALGLQAPGGALVATADEGKESALSWQKQARDTRATVIGVVKELNQLGDQGNPVVKNLIDDAGMWLKMADAEFAKGDKLMEKKDFRVASTAYNMAWQYLVKAATAGLNAKSILTGK